MSGSSGGFRFGSTRGAAQFVEGGYLPPVELGARFELLKQLRVLDHLAARPECFTPRRLDFQGGLGKLARFHLQWQMIGRNSGARLLPLRAGSPVLESSRRVDSPH